VAETAQTRPEERTDQVEPENRSTWIVIIALLVLLVAGYAIVQSLKKTPSAIISGTRAVVVPTDDAARTVIVTPCGTGANVLGENLATLRQTTGTTTFELPEGQGVRTVLVPACPAGKRATAGTSYLPSGAFIPAAGVSLPPIGGSKQPPVGSSSSSSPEAGSLVSAQYEVSIPNGSPIRTVVVSPCEAIKASTPAEQILGTTGSSSTVIAPPC
jgi:hypothetical protein